jgi:hypothetical protein
MKEIAEHESLENRHVSRLVVAFDLIHPGKDQYVFEKKKKKRFRTVQSYSVHAFMVSWYKSILNGVNHITVHHKKFTHVPSSYHGSPR